MLCAPGDTPSDISQSAVEAVGDAEGECESLSESIVVAGGRLPFSGYREAVEEDVASALREGAMSQLAMATAMAMDKVSARLSWSSV